MEAVLIRVNMMKEQLETIWTECSVFDANSYCPGTMNRFKKKLETFTNEIKDLFKFEAVSQDVVTHLSTFQLACEDHLAELEAGICGQRQDSNKHTKLPTIELMRFDGNVLNWQEFQDNFCSMIDNRQDISDVDKLSYLKSVLDGKAKGVLEGLKVTNNNYKVAMDSLKESFGSEVTLVDAHYRALYHLPTCTSDKVEDWRKTYNEMERHIRVLESLNENMTGNHLRVVVKEKFPETVQYELRIRAPKESRVEIIRRHINDIISAKEMASAKETESSFTTETLNVTEKPQPTKRKCNGRGGPAAKRRFPVHNPTCLFCRGPHSVNNCNLPAKERKEKLGQRCFICLKDTHKARACKSKKNCKTCGQHWHNTALCTQGNKKGEQKTESNAAVAQVGVLQTATVTLKAVGDFKTVKCRALLDSGSQRSYITSRLAKDLNLKYSENNCLMVYTFGSNKPKELQTPLVKFTIYTNTNLSRTMEANVVPLIADGVTNQGKFEDLIPENFKKSRILADDGTTNNRIDLLIGNNYYASFIHAEKTKIDEDLYLVNSDLGWILSGKCQPTQTNTLSFITYSNEATLTLTNNFVTPDLPLKENSVIKLWELETIGITDSPKTKRDEEAVDNFNKTVEYKDGRYYVTWPWVEYPPQLPVNFGLAYGRLLCLVNRLDTRSLREYEEIIQDQVKNGVVEIVSAPTNPNLQTTPPIHYIPHHMVCTEGKKGRIVYDASAKIKGQHSLNECLYKGPLMLEDLTGLLINFRTHLVAVSADIEKAFLQVGLHISDRDVTRFLWLKDISKGVTESNLLHMRFTRVPFGIVSSPFLLTATIRNHLARTNPELLETIADKCYADNLITGASSDKQALQLFGQTREIFGNLSMNLRDWVSNSKFLMGKISPSLQAKNTECAKILGMLWNTAQDTLQIKFDKQVADIEQVKSKRGVLSILGSVYDPCGIAAPILLPVKLFLQLLWKEKMKWDTELSGELLQQWKTAAEGLSDIRNISIPRCTCSQNPKGPFQLHCFTDAATNAYAAVVYLYEPNTRQVSFIMAKCRLAPLKDKEHLKIPKLELLGVLIGSRLMKYVHNALKLEVTDQILWTDSQIVWCWLHGNKLLSPFVARRVDEIKQNNLQIRYVPTKENPADVGTRPHRVDLLNSLWLTGPQFLKEDETKWPPQLQQHSLLAGEGLASTCEETSNDEHSEPNQESTEAYTYKDCSTQTAKLRELQQKHFPDEYRGKVTDLSRSLQLHKDDQGLIRCRDRFQNSDWSPDQKFPILLPRSAEYTFDIIDNIHRTNYHVGVSHTLALVRKKYWVPKGRSTVQKVLRKCIQCQKYTGGPFKLPPMPPLPEERVKCCPAFTYTGIDYMGPVLTSSKEKRWICVFSCLSTRAVHLEVVHNLTAEECNLAIRRFTATRGLPLQITSDNATQMKLTASVMTSDYCITNNIKWKFIPELAPWFGGFYERMMSLIKNCMKRTLEKHLLSDQQLLTVVKEIEGVLNTRPLTYVGQECDHVLTPADFLKIGGSLVSETSDKEHQEVGTDTKQNLIEGWKRGQRILQEFKNMFIGQYLPYLRQRNPQHKEARGKCDRLPIIGETVQIKAESHRANWKVGTIKEVVTSKDGNIRVAKVLLPNGTTLTRSIAHLYPLELDGEDRKDTGTSEIAQSSPQVDVPTGSASSTQEARPKRLAAVHARRLIKQMTTLLLANQF